MPTEEEYKQAINDFLDDLDSGGHDYSLPYQLKKRLLRLAGRDNRWLVGSSHYVHGPMFWQELGKDGIIRTVRTSEHYWDESDQTGEPDKFETEIYDISGGGESVWTDTIEEAMVCHNNAIERAKQAAEENARQQNPTT